MIEDRNSTKIDTRQIEIQKNNVKIMSEISKASKNIFNLIKCNEYICYLSSNSNITSEMVYILCNFETLYFFPHFLS